MSNIPLLIQEGFAKSAEGYEKVSLHYLVEQEFRMDASFYSKQAFVARKVVKECKYPSVQLGELASEFYNLGRFKRIWADHGLPYLAPHEIFEFLLPRGRFVSPSSTKHVEKFFVKDGWLLITCSGVPGESIIVTKSLTDYFLSHDIIRFISNGKMNVGYIHAFLQTWIGKAFLTKDNYGNSVDHIEPDQAYHIPVTSLPEDIRDRIHSNMMLCYDLRERGRQQLSEALGKLQERLNETIPNLDSHSFSVPRSELNYRFDVSYHIPKARKIASVLRERFKAEPIGKTGTKVTVAPRFKRIYVERGAGVPFLQGSHISMLRPLDLKYIARQTPKLNTWLVNEGLILVTCSGTIGRVSLVPQAWNKWAVSQHALRIEPSPTLDASFLAVFLISDWGYTQVLSKTYGGVVDEIDETGMNEVVVPQFERKEQEDIGSTAKSAFELRERANLIESATVSTLEDMLTDAKLSNNIESYKESLELIGNEELEVTLGLKEEKDGELESWEALRKEADFNASEH